MTVSSADPAELRMYAGRSTGLLADVAEATPAVASAVAALQTALPDAFKLTSTVDLTLPALGRARGVDVQVSVTADVFEQAGRGEGGVVTVDDAALPPLTPIFDQVTLDALTARLTDELTTLRERLASGSADETTLAELVGLLDMARILTDRGEVEGRGVEVAEGLVEHMGAGDVRVMLDMLEAAALEDDGLAMATGGFEDLAIVVSRGLEAQPARTERWVDSLTEGHDWFDGPPEGLVALAALGAPTTRTFGLAVWDEINQPRPGPPSLVTPRDARDGGLLDTMFDTTHAPQVVVRAAIDRPALANGIVLGADIDEFEELFGEPYYDVPRPRSMAGDLDALLVSSIDPSLPLNVRLSAASHAMTMVNEASDLAGTYRDETLTTLGTMTRPLLSNLDPNVGTIVFEAPAGGDATESADPLWDAAARLGNTDPGAAGLRTGLSGALDDLVASGRTDSASEPIKLETLGRLRRVREQMVTSVAGGRLDAIEADVESGGRTRDLDTTILDALGATPAEPVTVLVETVQNYRGDNAVEVVEGGSILGHQSEAAMTYRLVLANLAARPDLATPELMQGLTQAGIEGLADDDRRSAAIDRYL